MSVSTFNGINIAMRGLIAQQRALDTTTHNIANANTEGYTRQRVQLQSTGTAGYGVWSKNAAGIGPALWHWFQNADVHRQGADEFGFRHAGASAGGNELGHREQVRSDFDVTWRGDSSPAVIHGGRRGSAREWLFDCGCGW